MLLYGLWDLHSPVCLILSTSYGLTFFFKVCLVCFLKVMGRPFPNNSDPLIDLVLELTLNSIDVLGMEQLQDQDNVYLSPVKSYKSVLFPSLPAGNRFHAFQSPSIFMKILFIHLVTLLFNFMTKFGFGLWKKEWKTVEFFSPQKVLIFLPLF